MFYCKELFLVKHKSKYSCKSVVYFDLSPDIIKENCKFTLYYNKTDITPTVPDGGNDIILANWKKMINKLSAMSIMTFQLKSPVILMY